MVWLLGFQSFLLVGFAIFVLYKYFVLQKEMLKYIGSKTIGEKVEADFKEKVYALEYKETKDFLREQKEKNAGNKKIDLGNGQFVNIDDLIPITRAEDLE